MIKRSGFWLTVLGGVLALPWPALAEEGGKAPFPQLDVAQYPGLLFWLVITFPLLFVLMQFVAAPRVERTQDNRRRLLREDLETAEKDNEQARALQAAYEKSLSEARSAAQESISAMVMAAAEEEAKQRAAQQQKLNIRVVEAEKRVAAFRETARKEGKQAAAELAEAIVGELTATVRKGA